jgi:integrase
MAVRLCQRWGQDADAPDGPIAVALPGNAADALPARDRSGAGTPIREPEQPGAERIRPRRREQPTPGRDAWGAITSHRARSTIATQLVNAKEPLSLFELQECLGHRSPHATQHYARITPTKLARS